LKVNILLYFFIIVMIIYGCIGHTTKSYDDTYTMDFYNDSHNYFSECMGLLHNVAIVKWILQSNNDTLISEFYKSSDFLKNAEQSYDSVTVFIDSFSISFMQESSVKGYAFIDSVEIAFIDSTEIYSDFNKGFINYYFRYISNDDYKTKYSSVIEGIRIKNDILNEKRINKLILKASIHCEIDKEKNVDISISKIVLNVTIKMRDKESNLFSTKKEKITLSYKKIENNWSFISADKSLLELIY
jgi:hypothetical protein